MAVQFQSRGLDQTLRSRNTIGKRTSIYTVHLPLEPYFDLSSNVLLPLIVRLVSTRNIMSAPIARPSTPTMV